MKRYVLLIPLLCVAASGVLVAESPSDVGFVTQLQPDPTGLFRLFRIDLTENMVVDSVRTNPARGGQQSLPMASSVLADPLRVTMPVSTTKQ